jgi:hypothetical protein
VKWIGEAAGIISDRENTSQADMMQVRWKGDDGHETQGFESL